jgi:hypothetical protein
MVYYFVNCLLPLFFTGGAYNLQFGSFPMNGGTGGSTMVRSSTLFLQLAVLISIWSSFWFFFSPFF